jgi:hypothetical protein
MYVGAVFDLLSLVRLWDSCTVLQRWSMKVMVILLLNFTLHLIKPARGLWEDRCIAAMDISYRLMKYASALHCF